MNGLLTVWSNSSSRRLSADLRELIAAGLGETSFLSKCSPYSCTETTHHNRATDHSLANKTVVQLRPKSTIGSSFFYWSISGTFVGGYDPSPEIFFRFAFLCELMLLFVSIYA